LETNLKNLILFILLISPAGLHSISCFFVLPPKLKDCISIQIGIGVMTYRMGWCELRERENKRVNEYGSLFIIKEQYLNFVGKSFLKIFLVEK